MCYSSRCIGVHLAGRACVGRRRGMAERGLMRVWTVQTVVVRDRRGGQPVCDSVFPELPAAGKKCRARSEYSRNNSQGDAEEAYPVRKLNVRHRSRKILDVTVRAKNSAAFYITRSDVDAGTL